MGLAQTKRRAKLSHDPNNTTWSNNSNTFGHRILRSQGWEPGQYLGAKDASYAELHTAASASHIKVLVKDDNLGIGARNGGERPGECTGLEGFKDLLGRLNGEDEKEIDARRERRADARRQLYLEGRWGSTRFVSGGWLVGNKIEDLIARESRRKEYKEIPEPIEVEAASERKNERKKRKREAKENELVINADTKREKKKRKVKAAEVDFSQGCEVRKSKTRQQRLEAETDPESGSMAEQKDKEKRRASPKKSAGAVEGGISAKLHQDTLDGDGRDHSAPEVIALRVKKPKKDKKGGKQSRSSKKPSKPILHIIGGDDEEEEEKEEEDATPHHENTIKKGRKAQKPSSPPPPSNPPTKLNTPILTGRHAVRARHIAQKRMACMDVAALNQIFMVKGPV